MTVFSFIIFSIVTKKWKFWLVFDINDFQVVWSADLTADECSVKILRYRRKPFLSRRQDVSVHLSFFLQAYTRNKESHIQYICVCVCGLY